MFTIAFLGDSGFGGGSRREGGFGRKNYGDDRGGIFVSSLCVCICVISIFSTKQFLSTQLVIVLLDVFLDVEGKCDVFSG